MSTPGGRRAHHARTVDEELKALPQRLSSDGRARLAALLPELLGRASHSLGMAVDVARMDPLSAVAHLIFARRAIEAALSRAAPSLRA